MKKTYTISKEDIKILKKRVPNPCVIERCTRGQAQTDYAYCGCGYEAHCDRHHTYQIFKGQAEAAGLWDLVQLLFRIDAIHARQAELQKGVTEATAKIDVEYGWAITDLINKELYDGKL